MSQEAARQEAVVEPVAPWKWEPRVGETVDGYVLEAEVGRGGFGIVFRARRGGRPYAVKFLDMNRVSGWAWRELDMLLRVRRMGGVALEGHGRWPVESPRYIYLVMEYVRGRSLYEWAREVNPTGRQVGSLLLPLARYVAEMHAERVVHRDIKGENILVRVDGWPVLVDFGVGTWPGAPEVTGWDVPGSRHYQSPEALLFMRQREGEERSPCRPGDDVWALGVVLYKLLTDAFPFEALYDDVLVESIIADTPAPPRVRNPRVPPALGELCLRLLEKEPGARLGEARALADALEVALAEADAAWDVPLCEAYTPDNVSTPRRPSMPLDLRSELARMRRLKAYPPRRGPRPPVPEASSPEAPPPAGDDPPASVEAAESVRPASPAPWRRKRLWCGAGLVLSGLIVATSFPSSTGSEVLAGPPRVAPAEPVCGPVPHELEATASGQEMAPPSRALEGDEGAAPPGASTPAPVASATLQKDSTRVKTPQPRSPVTEQKQHSSDTLMESLGKGCLLGVVVAQAACSGPQVRPPPPPEDCPPQAIANMERLKSWGSAGAKLGKQPPLRVTVREGPGATVRLFDDLGGLQAGTVLTGRYIIGQERVYGRFYEARDPDSNETFPVCFIIGKRKEIGAEILERPGPDTATVVISQDVKSVRRFE
jgi:serine/threonine protein kinase